MTDVTGAISQMVMLLIVMAVGYAAAKLDYLDEHTQSKLTKLLLNITLPCMILASVGDLKPNASRAQIPWAFALAALEFFLMLAAGALCIAVLRVPREQWRTYLFISVCTNFSFIGLPMTEAVYGGGAVLLASIFVMVISLFLYSVGFAIIAPHGNGVNWKAILNPATVGCILAIILFLCGVRLPTFAENTLDLIGGITAPVAMLLVGVTMAGAHIREVLGEWRLYPFIVIKQLVIPALLFLALRHVVPAADATPLGVFVIMFAMPVGAMASMFMDEYGHDPVLPAKSIILSTLGSFVILPLLVLLMSAVG